MDVNMVRSNTANVRKCYCNSVVPPSNVMTFLPCVTEADVLSFNGSSLVQWDLQREPLSALKESIRFRFKTNQANGVVMYSRGTQNDYFAMQMRENRLLLNINLGKLTSMIYCLLLLFIFALTIIYSPCL